VGHVKRPGRLGRLGQMNREKGFSILEIILDLTKGLKKMIRGEFEVYFGFN
jgi:hypothetical protein